MRAALFLSVLLHLTPVYADTIAVGDSLAVGYASAAHVQAFARVGASSCAILRMVPAAHHERVVISAGTNDPPGSCVAAIRRAVHADRVVWIMPVNGAGPNVMHVAAMNGDRLVYYTPAYGGVHPASYGPMARSVGP